MKLHITVYRPSDTKIITDVIVTGTVDKMFVRVNFRREARSEARGEIWAKHQRLEAKSRSATIGSRRGPNQALSCVTVLLIERLTSDCRMKFAAVRPVLRAAVSMSSGTQFLAWPGKVPSKVPSKVEIDLGCTC